MYKILISDFEETLIDNEDAIPLSTMLSLDKIRTTKITFGVITNRSLKSILDYNKDFPFVDYIIAVNGAYIYDVNKNKPIVNANVPISVIKKIKKNFDDYNLCFYTLDWCNYTKEQVSGDYVRKIGDFSVFSSFHKDNIYKMEIHCPTKKEQTNIIKKLEELDLAIKYYARHGKDYYVEISSKDCDRLQAINKICTMKKAALKEVMMVGSNEDNIEAFKKVGMSIAVDNASMKLKRVAKDLTGSNNEKAVETAIKKYII